jgi:hypothetical protein
MSPPGGQKACPSPSRPPRPPRAGGNRGLGPAVAFWCAAAIRAGVPEDLGGLKEERRGHGEAYGVDYVRQVLRTDSVRAQSAAGRAPVVGVMAKDTRVRHAASG